MLQVLVFFLVLDFSDFSDQLICSDFFLLESMITRLFWWELKAGSFIGFTGKYLRQLGVLSSYWILLSYYQNCSDTMLFFVRRC